MENMKIGNFEIGQEELDMLMTRLTAQNPAFAQNPEFAKQAEGNLIEMTLFAAEAEEMGIEETEEFKASLAVARKDILSQMLVQQILAKATATEEEKKAYYEKYKQYFVSEGYAEAKHILVDSEEKANEIKAKLDAEEMTFEEAAKEFSSCPSAQEGGMLGKFKPGQMVPEFDKAVFEGPVNQLIGPVQTQFGFHLIVVTDKNEGQQMGFEDVEKELEQIVIQEKSQALYGAKVEELKLKFL